MKYRELSQELDRISYQMAIYRDQEAEIDEHDVLLDCVKEALEEAKGVEYRAVDD